MYAKTELLETLLTAPLVASVLGTSTRSVRRLVKDKHLEPLRIPHVRGYRFSRATVDALLAKSSHNGIPQEA